MSQPPQANEQPPKRRPPLAEDEPNATPVRAQKSKGKQAVDGGSKRKLTTAKARQDEPNEDSDDAHSTASLAKRKKAA